MRIIIDIVILLILASCTWAGLRKGIMHEIEGILIFIVSLAVALTVSYFVSDFAVTTFKPFVSGYMESKCETTAMEKIDFNNEEKSLNDAILNKPELAYDYSEECFIAFGYHEKRADDLAEKAVSKYNDGASITDAVILTACETLCYLFCAVLIFTLVLIFINVILNLFDISLTVPAFEKNDSKFGAITGLVKGFLISIVICWLLSFMGAIIGRSTLDDTLLGKFFLLFEFLTDAII